MALVSTRVRIHSLASPSAIKEEESAVERVFFEILGVADPIRYRVLVSESSGWIEYVDTEQVWRKGLPPRLSDTSGAKKAAEDFLRSLTKALSAPANAKLPESLGQMVLMPPNLKPTELSQVLRPDGSAADHWLYRARPQLSATRPNRRPIDVFGSQVEVRVGAGGKVISYHARWRPVVHEHVYVDLAPFPRADDPPPNALVYLLEGDGIPQYYLAPYYLVNTGHELSFASASSYSLDVVIIAEDGKEEETRLTAYVGGGSGNYTFNWAVYSLQTVLGEGYRELGEGTREPLQINDNSKVMTSRMDIGPGAYVVMVNVIDRETGAFRHYRQEVFAPVKVEVELRAPSASPMV